MLLAEISTESIYCSEYLSRSVTRGVSGIPSVYTGMQSSTAVLRKGNDVQVCHVTLMVWHMPRHLLTRLDELSDL
jgi:hypothetical protein